MLNSIINKQAKTNPTPPDSTLSRFLSAFSLRFLLENLTGSQKEKFVRLIEKNKPGKALSFALRKRPELKDQFEVALKQRLEKIKKHE